MLKVFIMFDLSEYYKLCDGTNRKTLKLKKFFAQRCIV